MSHVIPSGARELEGRVAPRCPPHGAALTAGCLATLGMTRAALAHAGHHHLEPSTVMRWWSWEPFVVLSLVVGHP